MVPNSSLREAREAVVHAHVEAEERHDIDAIVATFHSARYEVAPFGLSVGSKEVRDLWSKTLIGFPDWHIETGVLRHGDDFVLVEVRMTGTHKGPWAGWEPTGRIINVQAACIFEFDNEHLVCEKVYFDFARVMHQLGKLPDGGYAPQDHNNKKGEKRR